VTTKPIHASAPARSRLRGPASGGETDAAHLGRLRWAVRAVLTLGVTASIAANVLHARQNLISQIIAAWPPLALLLTVELISRVPADRRWLAAARLIAAAVIAGIAAWVSYWHMAGVAARYGETGADASYLLPISVDGLVVVASISLVEIAGRIRTTSSDPHPATTPVQDPPASSNRPGTQPRADPAAALPLLAASGGQWAPLVPPTARAERDPAVVHRPRGGPPELGVPEETHAAVAHREGREHREVSTADGSISAGAAAKPAGPGAVDGARYVAAGGRDSDNGAILRSHGVTGAAGQKTQAPGGPGFGDGSDQGEGSDEGVVPSDTAAAVAYWHGRDPSLHPADIAAKIGRSERTVRRHWPQAPARTEQVSVS